MGLTMVAVMVLVVLAAIVMLARITARVNANVLGSMNEKWLKAYRGSHSP